VGERGLQLVPRPIYLGWSIEKQIYRKDLCTVSGLRSSSRNTVVLIFFPSPLVPSRGPENVSTTEVNYTTFRIAWIALPIEASNGNIKMYQIKLILNKTCTAAQSPTYLMLNTTTREVLLSSLSICTRYDLAVRAYTMAGPGPYSKSIAFQTLGEWYSSADSYVLVKNKVTVIILLCRF